MKMRNLIFVGALAMLSLWMGCGFNAQDPGPTFEEQLAIDMDLIDAYLVNNEIDAELHGSGISYVHDVIGDGQSPEHGDVVVIKFKSTLFNGEEFIEDSLGLTITLNYPTIAVLQIMIPEMNEGGRATLYTPSGYAFGNVDLTGLPRNTNLIFEVELVRIIDNAEEQLEADLDIIDEFLAESEIVANIHESGIRYVTLVEGTGDSPQTNSLVLVKYKGSFLNGDIFDQNATGVSFSLGTLIEAWKIMIPTMKEGGKLRMFAPSKYCYGPQGSNSIPSNTILVFEVELVSF
jgi:FKBP-type peptidyl-prolyl cis-trans isomerase FkpA